MGGINSTRCSLFLRRHATMQQLLRIDEYVARIEKWAVVLLFAGIILLVFFNILTRNLLNASFQIVFEIAPAMVLWLALIGSSLALKHQKHIRIELVLRYLPPGIKRMAAVACGIFGMTVMGLLILASLEFVSNEIDIFGRFGWVSIIFPTFFTLSFLRYGLAALTSIYDRPKI